MADNRMYLVHRPTGLAVLLGKSLGWGWYGEDVQVQRLYDALDQLGYCQHENINDFSLAMEDVSQTPMAKAILKYGDVRLDGLRRLTLDTWLASCDES